MQNVVLKKLDEIAGKAIKGEDVSFEDASFLAETAPLSDLLERADKIRERFFGKNVTFCVIVNARSGACSEDCRFCAQSAHYDTGAQIYPLLNSELVLEAASKMSESGAVSFGIVTSGPSADDKELASILSSIESVSSKTSFAPCASLGKLTEEQLRRLKKHGLTRYHHNLETSREFFSSVCTTHTWDERVETIKTAKRVGLKVCSGGLFGMGETWNDRISMAMSLRQLGVDSVPVNFLRPVPGTPFENMAILSPEEGLRIIALYRFMLPSVIIRVCGGRVITLGDRQRDMFRAGANAIMTGDYLTTPGVDSAVDREMVRELGFNLVQDIVLSSC